MKFNEAGLKTILLLYIDKDHATISVRRNRNNCDRQQCLHSQTIYIYLLL